MGGGSETPNTRCRWQVNLRFEVASPRACVKAASPTRKGRQHPSNRTFFFSPSFLPLFFNAAGMLPTHFLRPVDEGSFLRAGFGLWLSPPVRGCNFLTVCLNAILFVVVVYAGPGLFIARTCLHYATRASVSRRKKGRTAASAVP